MGRAGFRLVLLEEGVKFGVSPFVQPLVEVGVAVLVAAAENRSASYK